MSGHAAGDRMDTELHVNATLGERVVQFAHTMLRLCHRHSITGHNHDAVRRR